MFERFFLIIKLFLLTRKVYHFCLKLNSDQAKIFLDEFEILSLFVNFFENKRYFNHLINIYFVEYNWDNHTSLKNIDNAKRSNFLLFLRNKKHIILSMKQFFKNSKLFYIYFQKENRFLFQSLKY